MVNHIQICDKTNYIDGKRASILVIFINQRIVMNQI